MLAAISEWVKNIVLIVLFASFLELLLPSSAMQRFVRVIMGLLVLLAVLNPVLDVLSARLTPEVPALAAANGAAAERARNGAKIMVRERERVAAELYRRDLARQMRAVVAAVDGVADAKVTVTTAAADGRPGAVERVTVYVRPGNAREGKAVPKVAIGPDNADKTPDLNPALRDKIVRTVCEIYQLAARQVEVVKMN